jgi:hypothetical protein
MDLQQLLEIAKLVAIIGASGTFFYFYFTKPKVKEVTNKVLKYLPGLLMFLISRTKDDPNKFDAHDFLVLVSNVVTEMQVIVSDPTNVEFADVQDEITALVQAELKRLRDANVPGVPDVNDKGIPTIVRVIFEQIKAVTHEG